jgi:hypothetical protein
VFVRPAGGVALQMFSGIDAEGSGFGPALSLAVGWRQPAGARMHVAPEFVARGSVTHGAAHWQFGGQLGIGWGR